VSRSSDEVGVLFGFVLLWAKTGWVYKAKATANREAKTIKNRFFIRLIVV
jgi:hypothetical protein